MATDQTEGPAQKNEIIEGDAREVLKEIEDESIQLTVTSPPYNIDIDYGDYDDRKPIEEWRALMEDVMQELFRITPPDGKVCFVVGVSYGNVDEHGRYYRIPLNKHIIEIAQDVGFDLFDEYAWVKQQFATHGGGALYGSYPYPSNLMATQMHEYILVFRKWVDSDYYSERNIPEKGSDKREDSKVTKKEWREYTRSKWEIPPVDPESVGIDIEDAAEKPEAVLERLIGAYAKEVDEDAAKRVAEAVGTENFDTDVSDIVGEREKSVWEVEAAKPSQLGIEHNAVFPEEIPRRLIKMYSFVGDTVLDPFMGTGSTAKAALDVDRHYLGIERNPDYIQTAKRRIQGRLEETVDERKRAQRAERTIRDGHEQMRLDNLGNGEQ